VPYVRNRLILNILKRLRLLDINIIVRVRIVVRLKMEVIKEDIIEVFGEKMIVQLVEYETEVTKRSYPYDLSEGRKFTKIRRLRFKNKFDGSGLK